MKHNDELQEKPWTLEVLFQNQDKGSYSEYAHLEKGIIYIDCMLNKYVQGTKGGTIEGGTLY